ncbi:histidine phosphatase family protein [Deinococcus peraridilitoris]|uniref:histidine phosphatase family protein n=1 Tax=Deinococcus peraridilitoris TaxID=432329 RepID=UPI0002FE687E|nr:histidine phosphatase family protein [Deinococcus peraridilitoris]
MRHGENRANVTRELSCRLVDYPLTERGRLQARQTAQHFAATPVDALFASPLRRAQETAQPLAELLGLPVQTLEELREIDVGELEDPSSPYSLEERRRRDNEVVTAWRAGRFETRYPGGENYLEAATRFKTALRRALTGRSGETVMLIGHSGLYQCALPMLCPQGYLQHLSTNIPLGGYSHLSVHALSPLRATLHTWAVNDHLAGDARLQPDRPDHLRSAHTIPPLSEVPHA